MCPAGEREPWKDEVGDRSNPVCSCRGVPLVAVWVMDFRATPKAAVPLEKVKELWWSWWERVRADSQALGKGRGCRPRGAPTGGEASRRTGAWTAPPSVTALRGGW